MDVILIFLRSKKWLVLGVLLLLTVSAMAYKTTKSSTLTMSQLINVIQKSNLDDQLTITATPEVLNAVNDIIGSAHARAFMRDSLKRMQQYKSDIQSILKDSTIPPDFIAIPLMESHYINGKKRNFAGPAGIWQITPSTAKMLGLVVNNKRDDRLNVALSTKAIARYFTILYNKFHDWDLVLIAYNIGDGATEGLIKAVGSKDKWTLVRSKQAPNQLTPFLSVFEADVIIMHNTDLLQSK
jgi:membrane-bound lytic murein transglycosylase D